MALAKKLRRTLRPAGKTVQSVLRWKRLSFDEAPPILGNSKPKSGSHLLLQILNGFTQIMPYKYVEADPVRTIEKNGRRKTKEEILNELKDVPKGVIGWGYVDATLENVSFLTKTGRVNYFIYRDPRDMLISQLFFATDMHEEHGMHEYYKSLPDFNARLKVTINGIEKDGLTIVCVKQRYEAVFHWLELKHHISVPYLILINELHPS